MQSHYVKLTKHELVDEYTTLRQRQLDEDAPMDLECALNILTILEILREQHKFYDDHMWYMANSCLACCYFNLKQYNDAAIHYQKTIQHIVDNNTNLSDVHYRRLAGTYIDVMDSYLALYNTQAALYALHKAIKAHKYIKSPSSIEAAFQTHTSDLVKFRLHYEKKSSTRAFINSTKYNNQNAIILQVYEEYFMHCLTDDIVEYSLDKTSVFCNQIAAKQMSQEHYAQLINYFLQIAENHINKIRSSTSQDNKDNDYKGKAKDAISHATKTIMHLSADHPDKPRLQIRISQLQQQINTVSAPVIAQQTMFNTLHVRQEHSTMDVDDSVNHNQPPNSQVFH